MILLNDKEAVGDFVGLLLGTTEPWTNYEAIGIVKNDEIIAGVVIEDYVLNARCSVHCAGIGKKWLTRDFLSVVFNYVFVQLDCKVIVNIVESSNLDSVKFTSHLGFTNVYTVKGGGADGGDVLIFEMQKQDCKWIRENNG